MDPAPYDLSCFSSKGLAYNERPNEIGKNDRIKIEKTTDLINDSIVSTS